MKLYVPVQKRQSLKAYERQGTIEKDVGNVRPSGSRLAGYRDLVRPTSDELSSSEQSANIPRRRVSDTAAESRSSCASTAGSDLESKDSAERLPELLTRLSLGEPMGFDPRRQILQLSEVPPSYKTADLSELFQGVDSANYRIKWLDSTHALIIFRESKLGMHF